VNEVLGGQEGDRGRGAGGGRAACCGCRERTYFGLIPSTLERGDVVVRGDDLHGELGARTLLVFALLWARARARAQPRRGR
jgi:hypothetical protein